MLLLILCRRRFHRGRALCERRHETSSSAVQEKLVLVALEEEEAAEVEDKTKAK
jgi:hypothetical protein